MAMTRENTVMESKSRLQMEYPDAITLMLQTRVARGKYVGSLIGRVWMSAITAVLSSCQSLKNEMQQKICQSGTREAA
jgi:hypothetical protein